MLIYVVKSGDSLYSIAKNYGVSAERLAKDNQLAYPQKLVVGQALVIPSPPQRVGSIEMNGYAYPYIKEDVYKKTLPFLTFVSLFSYELRTGGSKLLSSIPTGKKIAQAYDNNVGPIMVVSNIIEGGNFNSDLASTFLSSKDMSQRLIDEIMKTVIENDYYGVDVDFEYVYARDRDNYNDFLRRLSKRLHDEGRILTTAIAAKNSDSVRGILYEGHDYAAHGEYADRVTLMTYEWGYMYGPPQAVSPLNLVEEVIQYATSVMPSGKILMGVPNYGYDWVVPYVKGSKAQIVTNPGAVTIAVENGAPIRFDPVAKTPFFRYNHAGKTHEVWFEDARSIEAKLELVRKYNLAGVSVWQIGTYFSQLWLVTDGLFTVEKFV